MTIVKDDGERQQLIDKPPKSFPKLQVFVLCAAACIEPIAASAPGPFLPALLLSTGVTDVKGLGRYAGILSGSFAFAEVLFLVQWAKLSDRVGRKPALMTTMLTSAIFIAAFGFSKQFWQMLLCRLLAGVFNGNATLIRTTLAEVGKADPSRVFSYYAFSRNMGMFLGPFLGGFLVEPEANLPNTFGKIRLFRRFPYALPGVCVALLSLCITLSLYCILEEPEHEDIEGTEKPSIAATLKRPGIPIMLCMEALSTVLGVSFGSLFPLFAFTPPALGGLGFKPPQIALFISCGGASQAAWLLLAFPPLSKRLGPRKVLRSCLAVWPIIFILFMCANWAARRHSLAGTWSALAPVSALQGVAMAFTANQLLTNAFAGKAALATANAMSQSLSAGLRSIIPFAVGSTFAASHNILNGQLIWIILIVVVELQFFLSASVPKSDAEGE